MSTTSSTPPSSFMGGPDLTQSNSTLPASFQNIQSNSQTNTGYKPEITSTQMNDISQIAMFTAVGYIGLHLVIRPLIRKGIRSFIFKAKKYESSTKESNNEDTLPNGNGTINENNKSKLKLKNKLMSNNISGFSGPYGEIVTTFAALTGITYIAHPENILLYFGMIYPSMPFVLRAVDTINGNKYSMTVPRFLRLTGKSVFITMSYGFTMAIVGPMFQLIPFFNIIALAFWDSLTDFIISDGPNS